MEVKIYHRYTFGIRMAIVVRKKEIARITLYFLHNDLHDQPFGLVEDLWVAESRRGQGLGKLLVQKALDEAKKYGCYKVIATSRAERPKVHKFYGDLGFSDYGKEFRLNLKGEK